MSPHPISLNGRREAAQELAKKIESLRDDAHDEGRRCEGAILALSRAASQIAELREHGSGEQWGDVGREAAEATFERCLGCVQALVEASRADALLRHGRVQASDAALDVAQAYFERQTVELRAALDAPAAEPPKKRPVGSHPGEGIAQRRRKPGKKAAHG